MWDTFDLLTFNVILGSFGVLLSKWPVTRKQLHVAVEKRTEFWDSGGSCNSILYLEFGGSSHSVR